MSTTFVTNRDARTWTVTTTRGARIRFYLGLRRSGYGRWFSARCAWYATVEDGSTRVKTRDDKVLKP